MAWVMEELVRTLDEVDRTVTQFVQDNMAARASDLSEVDGTGLRVVRQHIHQAVGALEMVELAAAAQTLRALEAAIQRLLQKPALATPEAAQVVRQGTHAVLDYLNRLMRQRPLPALALFPTYLDWQQLAGVSRFHPADLWDNEPCDAVLPPGKTYEPGPAVRAHLDRLVLLVVKSLSPQAATPLAQLAAGLARGAGDAEVRRFWLAAAAYFEAVAAGALPDSVYVKRAASSVLLQYAQLSQGDRSGLAAHTHQLLFLIAQAPPSDDVGGLGYREAVWQAQGWPRAPVWDFEARTLGRYPPAALAELRQQVIRAQQAWSSLGAEGNGESLAQAAGPLRQLAEGLGTLLPSEPALQALARAWGGVADVFAATPPSAWPGGLSLEVSNGLLLLEAVLDESDPIDPETAPRLDALARRLDGVLRGEPAPDPETWMSAAYRRLSERETLAQVIAQWQAELEAVELALDAMFRQHDTAALAGLDAVIERLDRTRGIAALLELPDALRTLEVVRDDVRAWAARTDRATAETMQLTASRLGPNVSMLGWLLDTYNRQPELARQAYRFDEAAGLLRSTLPGGETSAPRPLAMPDTPAAPAAEAANDEEDLRAIFVEEARAVFAGARETLQILRSNPGSLPDLTALRRGFHTLKGSARMVELAGLGEAAWAMEQLLNAWLAEQKPASAPLLDLSAQVLTYLQDWVDRLQSGMPEQEAGDAAAVRASADALRLEGRYMPLPAGATIPVLLETVDASLAPVPPSAADLPVLDEPVKVIGPLRIDLDLYNVFLNEADEWSRRLGHALSEWCLVPGEPLPDGLSALAHSLAGGAATVGHLGLSQLARALEHALDRIAALASPTEAVSPAQARQIADAAEEARHLLHQFAAGFLREPQPQTLAVLAAIPGEPLQAAPLPPPEEQAPAVDAGVAAPAAPEAPAADVPDDRLDADLFAVFQDEAQQLLPRLSSALRQWVARPDNTGARAEVLRNLHTFKGSARLAGASRLGEMAHRLESDVLALPEVPASQALRPLQVAMDAMQTRFELLCQAYASATSEPGAQVPEGVTLQAPEGPTAPDIAAPLEPLPSTQTTVRIRADLLDRLMVQTGDVMLTRTRLEGDMRALRQSFKDMSGNIERLRSQLRDLEMQTETQMQSRMAQSREADARFDPLEFDRYTRVQELTRLLAESVNDVATVQHHMQRAVEAAEGNLAAQARQTRELQRDLLRTRLVAFDSLADRLHRVVRQAADAEGKLVELVIHHGEVEVDRGVLDRLAPALEHLLRNAVVHGIEAVAQRERWGKPGTGRLEIDLQASGNDLTLTLSDDGAGLDVERVRERAVAQGVHPADAPFGEADAARCIFASGLSTAASVTERAGRGIGLDVVRNEVLALGGRIEYFRPDAGGAAFRLLVPLSTAVTQVVMLRVGDFVLGVPAPWVRAVKRANASELTAAYLSGQWRDGEERMPFFWAGALLALSTESTDPQAHQARSWPVLEFYSAGQHVAWHVDEVLGHQEVVVKPLGPQLARLPGLAGATVLASGAVALIYNPVALASLYGEAARAWVRAQRAEGAQGRAASRPDSGAATQAPLVLVVDDSITVRRVTQRLLKREGYRVVQAADGLQALERLREELPVVVLCDIEMPRMDGFEFVRHLRGDPRWADLPVVMITSRLADKHREHAQSLGVDHYLGKPYAEDELLELVKAYARIAPPPASVQTFFTTA
nr:Hpt domain-containing protein [Tepidicella baoligensis]